MNPIHNDLADGGVDFDTLSTRSCVIHDCRFSPSNCNFQLSETAELCSFLSVAFHPDRGDAVITLHVLPVSAVSEAVVTGVLDASVSLRDILSRLSSLADSLTGTAAVVAGISLLIPPAE